MKIFWTAFAKKELQNIFDYYKIKASLKTAKKLVIEIVEHTAILDFQNKIGQKEELLSDRKENFRYLVYKNYKIIYWFNEQRIALKLLTFSIRAKNRQDNNQNQNTDDGLIDRFSHSLVSVF